MKITFDPTLLTIKKEKRCENYILFASKLNALKIRNRSGNSQNKFKNKNRRDFF